MECTSIDPHRTKYTDAELLAAEVLLNLGNNRLDQFIQQNGFELVTKKNKDYRDVIATYDTIDVLVREDKNARPQSITKNSVTLVEDENSTRYVD
jgi:hypothetical protein